MPAPPPGQPRLVLASASPRRRELLTLMGLEFEVIPSTVEELLPESHPAPARLAAMLATEKALAVAAAERDCLVIGADTIVALGRHVMGKPADAEDARSMLRRLSGRRHRVITAVAIVDTRPERPQLYVFHGQAYVTMRPLREAEIAAYVASGEPADKAGAYAIQGVGACLIEAVAGDYHSVVGLPVSRLATALQERGVPVLGYGPGVD